MDVIALVDGEHYPPVTRWGLRTASQRGYRVLAALLVGGIEKIGPDGRLDLGDVEVVDGRADTRATLSRLISERAAEGVLDLSDDPVLGYGRRMELIAVTLANGISYLGPDFRLDPPVTDQPLGTPTVAVIGVGKRVAKTAISAHLARVAAEAGHHPVIVAMGRGGPEAPVVVRPQDVTLEFLLAHAKRGEHAASDYLEDALMAGVPTIGARRCGGGLAGRPFVTNVADAAARAVAAGGDPVILEGSGAAVPTVPWDAGVLVAPADLHPEHLGGYLGPYRLLLSDLVVFIMDYGPGSAGPENLSTLESLARRLRTGIRVARAELLPVPLADVRGKDAFFATTAREQLAVRLGDELERMAGCHVVKISHRLADRAGLEEDLASAPPFEVLLTELKAAAVDVGARRATELGAAVVFVDNRPRSVGGDGDVDDLLREVVGLARGRATDRVRMASERD